MGFLDRGDAARGLFSRVARHLTHDLETLTRVSDSEEVLGLFDPDSYVWEETEGGGREMVQKTFYTRQQDLLDVGDQVDDAQGRRWKVIEADSEYLYGQIVGDVFKLERLFGG